MIPAEINSPEAGALLLVGRDPGEEEVRQGKPFVGTAGRVLTECLTEAGLRRSDVNIANVVGVRPPGNVFQAHHAGDVERGIAQLNELIERLRPGLIVALGNEAAWATVRAWPSKTGTIFNASGIEERRGYFFEGKSGVYVLPTVHPAAVARTWVPWRMLLAHDLRRAKEHCGRVQRPRREVEIVSSEDHAAQAERKLARYRRLAFDIENFDARQLACVGFAGDRSTATVFPARYLSFARRLLENRRIDKIAQNGQYDCYFLRTRCDVHVSGLAGDTMLQWHSLYPELAGATFGKGSKRTHKSLAFLASMFTLDEWWKDYEFTREEERYILNGKDCCVTLEVHDELDKLVRGMGVLDIYRHELALVPVCMAMLERGMRVDEGKRQKALEELATRKVALANEVANVALPLLQRWREQGGDMRLFLHTSVCRSCRNGSKKRLSCEACGGVGKFEKIDFNPNSEKQVKVLLYDILKLPKRFTGGSLTSDEDALKSLLAHVEADYAYV